MAKMKNKPSPSEELYAWIKASYDHFNERLFNGELPACIFTLQREKRTMGYFSPDRWAKSSGEQAHEIALNPAYFSESTIVEIFQTVVHEMCHLWQHVYGQSQSRTYHDKEWGNKMIGVGLMPSATGKEGGKQTGQKMNDYPIKGGKFLKACKELVANGQDLTWVDRIPATTPSCSARVNETWVDDDITADESLSVLITPIVNLVKDIEPVEEVTKQRKAKQKIKYSCKSCKTNVWGKPNLNIECSDCNAAFILEDNNA